MSEVKVNKISPRSGTDVTLGDSGDTFTIPSGATILNSGTASGFGDNLEWQSSIVTAATITVTANKGYWIDTTSNACTITLPAAAAVGDRLIFTDYARNWATYAVTIDPNSLNFQGYTTPQPVYDTNGESVDIVYSGATKGWIPNNDGAVVFETTQNYSAEYLIVGGGGSSGAESALSSYCCAGGAGGYRTNYGDTAITLSPSTVYTMTVGTGGASITTKVVGISGLNSSMSGSDISTITATGGGGGAGGGSLPLTNAGSGGSGGGAMNGVNGGTEGSGNTGGDGGAPSIPEGFDGGKSTSGSQGGAGGGAGEAGGTDGVGYGGDGLVNGIDGGGGTYYAGGGSGCSSAAVPFIPGGSGGGGKGARYNATGPADGTDGKGGGGGGQAGNVNTGGAGGDGVIILRVPTASVGTPSGEDSSAVDGADTVITWLATGSYTG